MSRLAAQDGRRRGSPAARATPRPAAAAQPCRPQALRARQGVVTGRQAAIGAQTQHRVMTMLSSSTVRIGYSTAGGAGAGSGVCLPARIRDRCRPRHPAP